MGWSIIKDQGACVLEKLKYLSNIKRIIILGAPGSGKTVFSSKLALLTGLPLIRLDDLYWGKNWKRLDTQTFMQELENELAKDAWIMDGNYHYRGLDQRIQRAEAVIVLDVPTIVALYGFISRSIKRFLGDKSTLPLHVVLSEMYQPEWELKPHLFYRILTFKWQVRPLLFNQLSWVREEKTVIIFKSREESQEYLKGLSVVSQDN